MNLISPLADALPKMLCSLFVILLLSLALSAPPMLAQAPPGTGVTEIRTGQLFDSERGIMLPARDIIVRGTLVDTVGEDLPVPEGAQIIDLSGYTVLRGLIDAHTHLLYLEDLRSNLATEGIRAVVMEGTPLRALRAAGRGRTYLDAGFTTVRDLGNSGLFGDVALQQAIREGSVPGPRVYPSGPGLSPEGGQFHDLGYGHRELARAEYRIVRGPDDARQAVRENVTYGAKVIKVYANNTPNPGYLSMEELGAIVDEARLLGVSVAAHATDDRAIRRAVLAGVNSIEHGYEVSDSTLQLMADRGVALVATDIDSVVIIPRSVKQARMEPAPTPEGIADYLRPQHERLRRALKAGVTIVAGSDSYADLDMPRGRAAKRVLFAYQQGGMTPAQVLQSTTVRAADLIGDNRLGRIARGAYADLIAVEGNPLQDLGSLERLRFVMKGGHVYLQQP